MDTMHIIKENEGLIYSIINRYTKYYDYEDLYQVAAMAINKASLNFNPSYNTKFSTYAYTYIVGDVLKYITNSYNFKVNREILKLNKKIQEARIILSQKNMKEASNKEIAEFLGIDESLIIEVENNTQIFDSLNREIESMGKTLFLEDTIKDDRDYYNIDNMLLHEMLEKLPKEEQQLIYARYFEDKTQSEVAKILGINQVQVSRCEKKILKKMHDNYQKITV